jgi:hypothetical protein
MNSRVRFSAKNILIISVHGVAKIPCFACVSGLTPGPSPKGERSRAHVADYGIHATIIEKRCLARI